MSNIINSVLQEWVMTLKWKAQTGLISAIRGVDMIDVDPTDTNINNKCKTITKMIRYLVLNNADSKTNFMTDIIPTIDELVDVLNEIHEQVSLGVVSNHWFNHVFLAIKIILDKHPNAYTRMYWLTVYTKYNISPSDSKEVKLKEVEVSNVTVEDIKNIISVIDSSDRIVDIDNNGLIDEPDILSFGDKLGSDYVKPIKPKKRKPAVESLLDTKNDYPNIDGKDPIVTDNSDSNVTDAVVYDLNPHKIHNKEDKYIHGEIRVEG